MSSIAPSFEFDYFGSEIVYGRGSIGRLADFMRKRDMDDALVVCGSHTGANDDLMDPIRQGLGDRYAGTYDGTTPRKTIYDVYDGIEVMEEIDPDLLVGVGGGSSLDVARQMGIFSADGRSLSEIRRAAEEGQLESPDPDGPVTPAVVIPTTFPGADLSSGGNIEILSPDDSPTGQPVFRKGANKPIGFFYDPNLFETTPTGVLAGSAMNGFNKGIETLYSRHATPITDATAVRGIRLLRDSLPHVSDDAEAMEQAVTGIILAQFRHKHSVIHAFAHGFSRRYAIQQGVVHGVLAPNVLAYVFDKIDGRRALFAEALGIDGTSLTDDELADAIVGEVAAIRDGLDVPSALREIDPVDPDDFPAIAEFIVDDSIMARGPADLRPTVAEIEGVLNEAW